MSYRFHLNFSDQNSGHIWQWLIFFKKKHNMNTFYLLVFVVLRMSCPYVQKSQKFHIVKTLCSCTISECREQGCISEPPLPWLDPLPSAVARKGNGGNGGPSQSGESKEQIVKTQLFFEIICPVFL